MAAIVLSHATALEWWRWAGSPAPDALLDVSAAQRALAASRGKLDAAVHEALELVGKLTELNAPVHLLTNERGQRRETATAHVHCMQASLPAGALAEITLAADGAAFPPDVSVFASTPEFCFVQMASHTCDFELAELGYQLCAQRDGESAPLTTPERLLAFAQAADNMTGAKRARRLAKHVLSGSCTADQTHIALLAHLPRSMGGMGTKAPLLDQRIAAPDVVARLIGARTLEPDLYWPEARIALEYDGRHAESPGASADLAARKKSAYRMLGIEVILLDRGSLSDADALRETFDHINRKCSTRLKPANEKQRARQEELLGWLRER